MASRPISPAWICSRRGGAGFTFVEVLMALVVVGRLIHALGVSLTTALRLENHARELRRTTQQAQRLSAEVFSGRVTEPTTKLRQKTEEGPVDWKVYALPVSSGPEFRLGVLLEED